MQHPSGHGGNKKWKLALAGLVGTYLALSVYGVATAYPDYTGRAGKGSASGAISAKRTKVTGGPASATTPATAAPSTASGSPAAQSLPVVSISAFGPNGTSDGDNPDIANRILDVSTDQPWYSQWYATPQFGRLRSGTGLLVDLGETMNVSDVQLLLGSEPGADIQVRVGNSPSVDLPTSASVMGAPGGAVRITTGKARGRYVLIWFTRLPPDGAGHYQVSVYNVTVDGTAPGSAG